MSFCQTTNPCFQISAWLADRLQPLITRECTWCRTGAPFEDVPKVIGHVGSPVIEHCPECNDTKLMWRWSKDPDGD